MKDGFKFCEPAGETKLPPVVKSLYETLILPLPLFAFKSTIILNCVQSPKDLEIVANTEPPGPKTSKSSFLSSSPTPNVVSLSLIWPSEFES